MAIAGVLLIMEDSKHRALIAAMLRRLGCEVFCAEDLDEAADLVRARRSPDIVLVYLGRRPLSAPALTGEMARRLPGFAVSTYDACECADAERLAARARLLN